MKLDSCPAGTKYQINACPTSDSAGTVVAGFGPTWTAHTRWVFDDEGRTEKVARTNLPIANEMAFLEIDTIGWEPGDYLYDVCFVDPTDVPWWSETVRVTITETITPRA